MTIIPAPTVEPVKQPETATDKKPEAPKDAKEPEVKSVGENGEKPPEANTQEWLSAKAKAQPRAGGKFVKKAPHPPVHPGEQKRSTG